MKRKVTIYVRPIQKTVEVDDNLEGHDIELDAELDRQVYDIIEPTIGEEVEIDYWEES